MGWLVWHIVAPSGGVKTTTVVAFEPTSTSPVDSVVNGFMGLQTALIACVREANGLPLDRIKVQSPFDARIKVNLYSALALVPRHQHRHLRQAERAALRKASGLGPRATALGQAAGPERLGVGSMTDSSARCTEGPAQA
jgi:hypothetical protein